MFFFHAVTNRRLNAIVNLVYPLPQSNLRQYDFGLVKLASPLIFSASVAPVCLPDPAFSSTKYVGRTGTVSGWGATDPEGMNTSTVLKDLEVTVLSNEECLEKLRDATEDRARAQGVNETMINFLRSNASLLRY